MSKRKKGTKYSETYRYGRLRLCKRIDSGIWYAEYKHPENGKRKEVSTGTTRKRDAEDVADMLAEQLHNHSLDIPDGSMPLEMFFEKFLAYKSRYLKRESLKALASTVTNLNKWMLASGTKVNRLKDLTVENVREFYIHRTDVERVATPTANKDIQNLSTMLKWAIREKLIAENVADYSKAGRVDLLKPPPLEKAVYSRAEYDALVREAEKRRYTLIRDLILVFANTGMRFQEVAELTPDSLQWKGVRPSIVVRAVERDGKDGKDVWTPKHSTEVKRIPMMPEVQEVLRRRSQKCKGYLFKNSVGNRIAGNHTRLKLQSLFPAVGIDRKRRPLHWHSFRRYFVRECILAGVPLNVIMSWTGHDTVEMALYYARASFDDSIDGVRKLESHLKKNDGGPDEDNENTLTKVAL